jgi:hypothetical protein
MVMALGSLCAAVVVTFIRLKPDDGAGETEGESDKAPALREVSATP